MNRTAFSCRCPHAAHGIQRGFLLGVLATLLGCALVMASYVWRPSAPSSPPGAQASAFVAIAPPPPIVAPSGLAWAIARRYAIAPQAARHIANLAWRAARRVGIPAPLFVAVVAVESGFNPVAGSRAGAIGLAQVRPAAHPVAAQQLGRRQWLHTGTNLLWGARILARCWQQHHGQTVAALQCYNGDPDDPMQRYARRVLAVEGWVRRNTGTTLAADAS